MVSYNCVTAHFVTEFTVHFVLEITANYFTEVVIPEGFVSTCSMSSRQLITSPLFHKKGRLSTLLMKRLLVRGGGVHIADTLERHGWSGDNPVATTVATVDPVSGVIQGFRFETRGQGPVVRFPAVELWPGVEEDIMVHIKLHDLSRLTWLTLGEASNQTNWIDSTEVSFEAVHAERGALEIEECDCLGMGGFVMGFTLLPIRVNSMYLYGGIFPLSKQELQEKLEAMGSEETSQMIPTVAMKLGQGRGRLQNGL